MKIILRLLLVLALLAGVSHTAFAKKVTYIASNKRFNFVKLQEIGLKDATRLAMTHPAELDGEKIRGALAALRLSKSYMVGDKTPESRPVFDEAAVNYLVPNLVKAFAQANANEQVVFAYLSKDPILIFRNDRLNIATAWLQGDVLNVKFNKLYAKVQGDTDARGNERRTQNDAKGLRVALDLAPGQSYSSDDADAVMIDLNVDYSAVAVAAAAPAEKTSAKNKKPAPTANAAPAPVVDERSPKERLQVIEQLKKDKLITEAEYNTKRQEILNQL